MKFIAQLLEREFNELNRAIKNSKEIKEAAQSMSYEDFQKSGLIDKIVNDFATAKIIKYQKAAERFKGNDIKVNVCNELIKNFRKLLS